MAHLLKVGRSVYLACLFADPKIICSIQPAIKSFDSEICIPPAAKAGV
jgi:hypothetical protein